MLGKIAEAQQQAKVIKERLDHISVEGLSAKGNIKVICTANRMVKHIEFEDSVLSQLSKPAFEAELIEAINDALAKAEHVSQTEMQNLMGKLMPGFGGLFGK
jgi:DNA-binding protein YbaB